MNNKGFLYAVLAYTAWGFLPIFWKQLAHVPAFEVLLHRIVWSLVFLLLLLTIQKSWSWLKIVWHSPSTQLIYLAATVLLSFNWGIYIWAVNANHIVETSLGYFINPLVSVFLGMVFLKERLRPVQWVAILLAAAGVLYFLLSGGDLVLWIALTLPLTFAFYGLLKKQAPLNSLKGLSLETALVALPSIILLGYWGLSGQGALGRIDRLTDLYLIGAGVATAVPLLFFGAAAPRIPLRMVGILQYIAPTLQFLIGIFIYQEPFDQTRFIGFCIIWTALLIYTIENFAHREKERVVAAVNLKEG